MRLHLIPTHTVMEHIAISDATVSGITTQHDKLIHTLHTDQHIDTSTNNGVLNLTIYTHIRSNNTTPVDHKLDSYSLPNSRPMTPSNELCIPHHHTSSLTSTEYNKLTQHVYNRRSSYAHNTSPTKQYIPPPRRASVSTVQSPTTSTRALGNAVTSLILAEPGTPLRLMKKVSRVNSIRNDGITTPRSPQSQLRLMNVKLKAARRIQKWYRKYRMLRATQLNNSIHENSILLPVVQEQLAELPPSSFARMSPNQRAKALATLQSPSMTPNTRLRTLHNRIKSTHNSPIKQPYNINTTYNNSPNTSFSLSPYTTPDTSMPSTPIKGSSAGSRSVLDMKLPSNECRPMNIANKNNNHKSLGKVRALVQGYIVRNILHQHSTHDLIRQIHDTTRLLKQTRDYAHSHNDSSSAQFAHQLQHQLSELKVRFIDLFTSHRKLLFHKLGSTPLTCTTSVSTSLTISPAKQYNSTQPCSNSRAHSQGGVGHGSIASSDQTTARKLIFDDINQFKSSPNLVSSSISSTIPLASTSTTNTSSPVTAPRRLLASTSRVSSRRLSNYNSSLIRARSKSNSRDHNRDIHCSLNTSQEIPTFNDMLQNHTTDTTKHIYNSSGQLLLSRDLMSLYPRNDSRASVDGNDLAHYRRASMPSIVLHDSVHASHRRITSQLPPRNPHNQKINLTAPASVSTTSQDVDMYRSDTSSNIDLSNSHEFSPQPSDDVNHQLYSHNRSYSTNKVDDYFYSKSPADDMMTSNDPDKQFFHAVKSSHDTVSHPLDRPPFMDQLVYSVKSINKLYNKPNNNNANLELANELPSVHSFSLPSTDQYNKHAPSQCSSMSAIAEYVYD